MFDITVPEGDFQGFPVHGAPGFRSVFGEIVTDLVPTVRTRHDTALFDIGRLGLAA